MVLLLGVVRLGEVPERSEFSPRLFDSPKSYDDARDSCQSHGGDLASVHSSSQKTLKSFPDLGWQERLAWVDGPSA